MTAPAELAADALTPAPDITLAAPRVVEPRGVRVILDARPLQAPDRAPVTAAYLAGLLGALDAAPLDGESFVFLLASDHDDPTVRFRGLHVVGRRLLPPVRLLRSVAGAVDPFLVRGAVVGSAWRAERGGAAGAVHHVASTSLPVASELPVVAALLDLAPWELPGLVRRAGAAGFARRLRTRLLREAAAVLVGTDAVGLRARRLLRLSRDRVVTVPLAPRPAFRPGILRAASLDEARRLGLGERYLVHAGRYDARHDLRTFLGALGRLARLPAPPGVPADAWPPRVCLVGASPEDRAAIARTAVAEGAVESLAYAPALPDERLAALVAGARAAVVPALSDVVGLAAIEALAAGVPVVASAVGALPELVGSGGILVEPRDPDRLAAALSTVWADDDARDRLADAARDRGAELPSWADVARATRAVWAEVARPSRLR